MVGNPETGDKTSFEDITPLKSAWLPAIDVAPVNTDFRRCHNFASSVRLVRRSRPKGLDSSEPIQQHGVQGQVLAYRISVHCI